MSGDELTALLRQPCDRCSDIRVALCRAGHLVDCARHNGVVKLLAGTYSATIRCTTCGDRGWVLTPAGQMLSETLMIVLVPPEPEQKDVNL